MKPSSTHPLQTSSFLASIPGRSGEEMKDSVVTFKCSSIKTLLHKYKVFAFTFMIANLFFAQYSFGQTQTFNYTGSNQTFNVPVGVTSVTVSAWGGGGCSGQNTGGAARGGGGGGAFTRGTIPVTPGNQLTIVVGAGGIYNNNSTTTDDGFASSVGPIVANGGSRGIIGNNVPINGGAGGTASTDPGGVTSFVSFTGGNGGNGYVAGAGGGGGGGGESASSTGIGNTGANGTTAGVGGCGVEPEMRQVETAEEAQIMMVILIVLLE